MNTIQTINNLDIEKEIFQNMASMYKIHRSYDETLTQNKTNDRDFFYDKIEEIKPFENELRDFIWELDEETKDILRGEN